MARVLILNPPAVPGPVLDIALSERNLLTLLSKLYKPGSACSLLNGDVPDGFAYACVRAEPDADHYSSSTRDGTPVRTMTPLSECVLTAVRAAITEFLADTETGGRQP